MNNVETNTFHWLILTGVPFENSGGGQRAAQIARTLLNNGHQITYVYAIDYREENAKVDIPTSNFETFHVSRFPTYRFIMKQFKSPNKLMILVEVPHPNFLPIIKYLKKYSFKTIYELIDPWDTELGHGWYQRSIEDEILELADVLTATAVSLQKKLEKRTGRSVRLFPNAYNDNLFVRGEYERPKDLPPGPIIGYVGALWGSWFDVDLVLGIAKRYPNYNIVLIGEYINQFDHITLPNIYFLGLKPQRELPAYLSYFQVGIIPFKVDEITHGVNPLKVYEYLAMGLPVVSIFIPELRGIPNVFLANSQENFIEKIGIALNSEAEFDELEDWLRQHTWEARIFRMYKCDIIL